MSRVRKKLYAFAVVCLLLFAVLPTGTVQADDGLDVHSERVYESPVTLVFEVTVTNTTDKVIEDLPLEVLFNGLPVSSINEVSTEQVHNEVYTGTDLTYTETGLASGGTTYYYSAWGTSDWGTGTEYSTTEGGGEEMLILTQFLVFPGIGVVLLLASLTRRRNILLSLITGLYWTGIGFWWLMSGLRSLGFDPSTDTWLPIIQYLPFVLSIVVLVNFFSGLGKTELTKQYEGQTWVEFGKPPSKTIDRSSEVKRIRKEKIQEAVKRSGVRKVRR